MKKNQKKTPMPEQSKLTFTPTAWAKLLFLRDYGDTEVGGFGICPNHPLLVEDIQLVAQTCSWAFVSFDDESVADFFDDQVNAGLCPEQFGRVWIHTHPGESAQPSTVDERTLSRVFGRANWAVMAILAKGGEAYAQIRLGGNSDRDIELPVEVDFAMDFEGSDQDAWEEEYLCHVTEEEHDFLDDLWDMKATLAALAEPLEQPYPFYEEELFEHQFNNMWP